MYGIFILTYHQQLQLRKYLLKKKVEFALLSVLISQHCLSRLFCQINVLVANFIMTYSTSFSSSFVSIMTNTFFFILFDFAFLLCFFNAPNEDEYHSFSFSINSI